MNLFPKNVNFLSTERYLDGGKSLENFENFNLALHVNDKRENVLENRSILKDYYGITIRSSMDKSNALFNLCGCFFN